MMKETNLLFESNLSKANQDYAVTFFTPTYNRRETIVRTYESLLAVVPAEFWGGKSNSIEWIIVDDGSTDGTENFGEEWCKENKLAIRYFKQENQGKHVAMNFAEKKARGKFWLTIDSDDTILPNALQIYAKVWNSIPENKREDFCGVSARCIDSDGNIVGDRLPFQPMDVTFTDLRMKYRIEGEMLEMYRVDVLKKYPFPEYDSRMRFCPEAIAWFEMAKKYKLRVVDEAVRTYYYDASVSIMRERSVKRSAANYYLWLYFVNHLSRYIFSYPMKIIKAYVGVSMDGFVAGKSAKEILKDINGWRKIPALLLMGAGWMLAKK